MVDRELANLVQAIKTTGISEALRDELERCEKCKANPGADSPGTPAETAPGALTAV